MGSGTLSKALPAPKVQKLRVQQTAGKQLQPLESEVLAPFYHFVDRQLGQCN